MKELQPGWCEEQPETERRCFRYSEEERVKSRTRGQSRGLRSRYALRALPPLEEDED